MCDRSSKPSALGGRSALILLPVRFFVCLVWERGHYPEWCLPIRERERNEGEGERDWDERTRGRERQIREGGKEGDREGERERDRGEREGVER